METHRLHRLFCLLGAFLCLGTAAKAQVSHGGRPLPLTRLRSAETIPFEKMPGFDLAEELRLDSLNESDLRSGYKFAYKFMTHLNRGNAGTSFVLPDGTTVWRLGIHSPGALSINVLFSEYELPEGARLFLYNEDQTRVLGAFTHENNSEAGILPVAPVPGERLIIEYQEPRGAAFAGRLTVGEVNHAYRSLRGKEPDEGAASASGIPALACLADEGSGYDEWGRSVVLMIIDGTVGCTGTLVNNTAGDGRPYLLTASHCLNKSFSVANPDYEKVAESIVCFYNYDSPLCDPVLRGTEEMSTASAHFRAVHEFYDMALLELFEMPPAYYQPYLAGWSIGGAGTGPYACIQHPRSATKRASLASGTPSLATLRDAAMIFAPDAHWLVKRWDTGYTDRGSSGAALMDGEGKVIGALSGGQSTAASPGNDYFYSLQKAWAANGSERRQLRCWLNPEEDGAKECEGMDPYAASPCVRLSNVGDSGKKETIVCSGYGETAEPLFGNNASGPTAFAEAYRANGEAVVHGAYLVTPPLEGDAEEMEVSIEVYGGDSPSTLLYTETFRPAYRHLSAEEGFTETAKALDRAQESFVRFREPVPVSGTFYVGYRFGDMPGQTYFAVYNLPEGASTANTAWVEAGGEWKTAADYAPAGFSTSLFIDPVIEYGSHVANETVATPEEALVYLDNNRTRLCIVLPETPGGSGGKAGYRLYSAGGQLVRQGALRERQTAVSLQGLAAGVYIVRIHCQGKEMARKILLGKT